MPTSKPVLVVAIALCFATIVLCYAPAKPKPPNQFQASYFTLGLHYDFTRIYFDAIGKQIRVDFWNQKGEKTDSFIRLFNIGKMYKLNSTACEFYMPLLPWSDPFVILNTATFAGNRTLPDGSLCDAWVNDSGFGSSFVSCWKDNVMKLQIVSGKNVPSVITYTTDYEPYVDKNVFELPKNCNNNQTVRGKKPLERNVAANSINLFAQYLH